VRGEEKTGGLHLQGNFVMAGGKKKGKRGKKERGKKGKKEPTGARLAREACPSRHPSKWKRKGRKGGEGGGGATNVRATLT